MERNSKNLRFVITVVLIAHTLGLIWLGTQSPITVAANTSTKKIVVQTVKLRDSPPKTVVAKEKPAPPKSKTVVAKEKPAPPKPKTVVVKAKPTPTKPQKVVAAKKQSKPKVDDKKMKLLKAAQESIAKIDRRSDKLEAKSSGQQSIGRVEKLSVTASANLSNSDSAYRDQLASRLRTLLQLPDYGEVELKLSLDRAGKVLKLLIVRTESEINKTYVEEALPQLSFSSFGKSFGSQSSHTFHITLTNE